MGKAPNLAEQLAKDVDNPEDGALLKKGANIDVHMRTHIKASRDKKDEKDKTTEDGVPELPKTASAASAASTPGEEKDLADVVPPPA